MPVLPFLAFVVAQASPRLQELAKADAAASSEYLRLVRTEVRALREIKGMLDRDEIKTAADFYQASGLIFNVPEYEGRLLSHELAMTASLLGSKDAAKRTALTWDRLQHDGGHPTRFGAIKGRPDKEGNRSVLDPDPNGPPPILKTILDGTAPPPEADNAELKSLMEADQKDRQNLNTPEDWDRMEANDGPRRARVLAILQEGKASSGPDLYHAALVLQHGEGYRDFMLAHELCLAAIARGYGEAAWLVSRTYDRMLDNGGRPQRFGTQKTGGRDGKTFYIMEADLPGPSDTMRKLFKSATREETRKGLADWAKSIDAP